MKADRSGNLPEIVITTGDVRGIGPEVIAKAVSRPGVRRWASYLVVGPQEAFNTERSGRFLDGCCLEPVDLDASVAVEGSGIIAKRVREGDGPPSEKGKTVAIPAELAGRWAGESIETAVKLIESGEADALVTGPIDKKALIAGGFPYRGHTGFLKELTGSQGVTMLLVGGQFRVSLVTTHIPVNEVSGRLTYDAVSGTVQRTIDALRRYFRLSSPKIAVCGMNPHIGEGGMIGGEEIEVIEPVVRHFRGHDADVSGPYPADAVFSRAVAGEYDAVVAMYHDQGLGPLKLHASGRGVNITIGLPFVRTSPDHGTAIDIAGKGIASERSMIHAIRMAREIL